jgi:glycosyltransferase involved in cell wall biosynthesis
MTVRRRQSASRCPMPPTSGLRLVALCTDARIDRRILDTCRLLGEHGYRPVVLAAPSPNGDLVDETSYPDLDIVRLRSAFVPPQHRLHVAEVLGPTDALFPWQQRLALAAVHQRPDVVIANDLPQLGAGAVAASVCGATLVYDAHELYPEQLAVRPQRLRLEEIERALLPLVDGVVTVNDSLADMMAMTYGIRRPEVVRNCPSRRHSREPLRDAGLLRRAAGVGAGTRLLLYQGGMVPNRGLLELVEGMRLLTVPDVALVLMGPRHVLGDALEARAAELGVLGTRVLFVPEVPASELLEWTVGADAGIVPYPHCDLNTLMCTPNKVFEYLVAGLPILASQGTELRRLVGDLGVGINTDLRTPEQFAAAIDRFFSADLAAFRARVRRLSGQFTFEVEGRRWPTIIAAATARRAARLAAGGARDSGLAP